ncbi:MAG: hypothetical protein AAF065_06260 [Verrucomicrobiota bacterium]
MQVAKIAILKNQLFILKSFVADAALVPVRAATGLVVALLLGTATQPRLHTNTGSKDRYPEKSTPDFAQSVKFVMLI